MLLVDLLSSIVYIVFLSLLSSKSSSFSMFNMLSSRHVTMASKRYPNWLRLRECFTGKNKQKKLRPKVSVLNLGNPLA